MTALLISIQETPQSSTTKVLLLANRAGMTRPFKLLIRLSSLIQVLPMLGTTSARLSNHLAIIVGRQRRFAKAKEIGYKG
jgi:hypothetical protein